MPTGDVCAAAGIDVSETASATPRTVRKIMRTDLRGKDGRAATRNSLARATECQRVDGRGGRMRETLSLALTIAMGRAASDARCGKLVSCPPGDDPRGARFPLGRGGIICFDHVRHRPPGTDPHFRDCAPRLWTEEPAPARPIARPRHA